jgi:acyl-CoA synthetase (AMP-forming)/AMP-acid ligase II
VSGIALRILEDHSGQALPELSPEAFSALCLPAGEIGEIVVSGPLVQKGYCNPEDDAETKIRVGDAVWHRTGDAGRLDADGVLWLLGRARAKVLAGGKPLYPFAVEAAASLFPQIRKAALATVRDKIILALEGGPLLPVQRASILKMHPAVGAIRYLERIPVDRRHQSKVLYAELERLLQNDR